jgi:hypothetical protein
VRKTYIHVYICIYINVYIYIYIHTYDCIQTSKHINVYHTDRPRVIDQEMIYIYVYIYMYVSTESDRIGIYVCIYVNEYLFK